MLQAMLAKYNQSIRLISVSILILIRCIDQLLVSRVFPMLLSHLLANIIPSTQFIDEKYSKHGTKTSRNNSITNSASRKAVVSTTYNCDTLDSHYRTNQKKANYKITIKTSSTFAVNLTRAAKILVNSSKFVQQYLTETQSKILLICRNLPIDNFSKIGYTFTKKHQNYLGSSIFSEFKNQTTLDLQRFNIQHLT